MKTSVSILLWVAALVLMTAGVLYQKMTGPTYPVHGKIKIGNEMIKYRLPRSHMGDGDEIIKIKCPANFQGKFKFRRYRSHDEFAEVPMKRDGEYLTANIPHQPSAGKVMYYVSLSPDGENWTPINKEDIKIRYTGQVPDWILWPHIVLMFLALVFGMRTMLEVFASGPSVMLYSVLTLVIIFLGGMVLGPLVQKYAFGAYWTGFPFGIDLTDNKTLIAVVAWLIAIWRMRKTPNQKWWAVAAAAVMIAVFLIPHSTLGSERDFTKESDSVINFINYFKIKLT